MKKPLKSASQENQEKLYWNNEKKYMISRDSGKAYLYPFVLLLIGGFIILSTGAAPVNPIPGPPCLPRYSRINQRIRLPPFIPYLVF